MPIYLIVFWVLFFKRKDIHFIRSYKMKQLFAKYVFFEVSTNNQQPLLSRRFPWWTQIFFFTLLTWNLKPKTQIPPHRHFEWFCAMQWSKIVSRTYENRKLGQITETENWDWKLLTHPTVTSSDFAQCNEAKLYREPLKPETWKTFKKLN